MVSISKKEARKAAKGQVKAATSIPAPKKSALKQPVVEAEESGDEQDWESEDNEEEDEENGGVSEAGMKRLMELVGEEDLDEYERAQLVDEDEDDEDDEDYSGDEDEELDDEDAESDEDVEEDEEMDGVGDTVLRATS